MELESNLIGSVDNVIPGIGIILLFVCGTVTALKYSFISRFDSIFMNSLDRNFRSIMRNLVLFVGLTGVLLLESYVLLSSRTKKMPITIVADIFIGIICIYLWIKNKRNQETKWVIKLQIKLYILYASCAFMQALAADSLNPNKAGAIVIGIFFSIISSIYTIVLFYDFEYKFFGDSQYFFIHRGIKYYLHYIVKDNLMLCSSTGNLGGNTDRYLIDISEIKCIKKDEGNNMITDNTDGNTAGAVLSDPKT